MNKEEEKMDQGLSVRSQKLTKTAYKRAILQAIESLHDFNTRSQLDYIRRHTQSILESHEWNEALFLSTLKNIVKSGDVDLYAHVSAELTPDYKRKRADSLLKRLEECRSELPELPHPPPDARFHPWSHVPPKEPPVRRDEHDKYKIVPKKIYDKETLVNPMDTRS